MPASRASKRADATVSGTVPGDGLCRWLVFALTLLDQLTQWVIVSPSQVFDLDDSFGRTYWVWLKTSGAPKRLVGGGGAPSGIVDMTRGRRWRQSLSSSAWSMPVPVRPA